MSLHRRGPRFLQRVLAALLAVVTTVVTASVADAQGPPVGGSGDRYYLRNSHTSGPADVSFAYGTHTDSVVVGDWDGNGTDTLGVRRGRTYYLKNSASGGNADVVFSYGTSTDAVLVGDWDGDGVDTLGLRRGSTYYLKNSQSGGNADVVLSYGTASDRALVGDWNGDGVDTLGLRRGSTYYLKNSLTGGSADVTFAYGTAGDVVLVGDWNGDRVDTLAVRRGSTVYLTNGLRGGAADLVYSFGRSSDAAFAGDWNGDRVDTLGLRRDLRPPPPRLTPVLEAQRILAKFAIPAGPADGVWGARTAQGMCTFRHLSGLGASRGPLTATDLARLRAFTASYSSLRAIPAPTRNGRTSYLLALKRCQTMLYVSGGDYVRVFRISTGKPEFETPNGDYLLGATLPGWSCSTLYPEGCYYYSQGMNALSDAKGVLYSKYGNMYNKRSIRGAYLLHGSTSVPTYPASHGCVRVSVADSDWMYRNMTNSAGRIYLSIVGSY